MSRDKSLWMLYKDKVNAALKTLMRYSKPKQ